MRKLKSGTATLFYLIFLCSILFESCEYYDLPVKEYLEYWSSTCQVGKMEYGSEYTYLDDVPQLSAKDFVEIRLYAVNPKGIPLLKKHTSPSEDYSFSFLDQDGKIVGSEYSEDANEQFTFVRIRTKFSDATEGQKMTLSGCLWPENRTGFSETELMSAYPQMFFSTSFVQNTPPDNISNFQVMTDFYPETQKAYLQFEYPEQSYNRNKNSTYEIKCYLRESDGKLYYKDSKILTLEDNKKPGAPRNKFYYYFDSQEDNLTSYEYTVQMTGPHGLKQELLATHPSLGVCVLVEPTITVMEEFNGLKDEDGFECIEVADNSTGISYDIAPGQAGDTLTVTVDGRSCGTSGTVSGIGQHVIKVVASRINARSVTVTKNIRIVKTQDKAEFEFGSEFNACGRDSDGYGYMEVGSASDVVTYKITAPEEGTTLSVEIDGTSFGELSEPKEGSLNVNRHTLIATVHKRYCNDVSVSEKVCVAKALEEPVFTFNPGLTGNKSGGFEFIEIGSEDLSYKLEPVSYDKNKGAKVSGSIEGVAFDETAVKSGSLPLGPYTFSGKVTMPYMTEKTFEKKINVVQALEVPEFICSDFTGNIDDKENEYIEIDPSVTTTTSITIQAGVGCTITGTCGSISIDSSTNTKTINLGTGGYEINGIVHKENYVDKPFAKKIKVVEYLQEPKFECSAFNGKTDSQGCKYIEVKDSSTKATYTVTAESECTITGSCGSISLNSSSNTKSVNIGPNVNPYEVSVTVHKPYYKDRTFTKLIRVIVSLGDPSIKCSNLNGEIYNEHEYIEISESLSYASYTIESDSGSTISGTDNGNGFNSTTNNTVTLSLAPGEHIINGTIKKTNYTDKTFTKRLMVVYELTNPKMDIYTIGGAIHKVSETHDAENTSYSSYETYTVNLTAGGTGELSYEFSGVGTITVTKNGTSIGTSGKFGLGPHSLSIKVTNPGQKPKTCTKDVYIQGILSDVTWNFSENSSGTEDGYTVYKFSYLTSENMWLKTPAGNTGNIVSISDFTPDSEGKVYLYPDIKYSLSVKQTRTYCKTKFSTKLVSIKVKPVKVTIGDCYLKCDFDDGWLDTTNEIAGKVHIGKNGSFQVLRDFGGGTNFEKQGEWEKFKKDSNPTFYLEKITDNISYKSTDMYEDDGAGTVSDDDIDEVNTYETLAKLAGDYRANKEVKIEVCNNDSSEKLTHKIMLNLSD